MSEYLGYWNKRFKRFSFWFDWVIFVEEVHSYIPSIMDECEVSVGEAQDMAWNDVYDAFEGRDNCNLWKPYRSFIESVPEEDLELTLGLLGVGFEIMFGSSELEATMDYIRTFQKDDEEPEVDKQ